MMKPGKIEDRGISSALLVIITALAGVAWIGTSTSYGSTGPAQIHEQTSATFVYTFNRNSVLDDRIEILHFAPEAATY